MENLVFVWRRWNAMSAGMACSKSVRTGFERTKSTHQELHKAINMGMLRKEMKKSARKYADSSCACEAVILFASNRSSKGLILEEWVEEIVGDSGKLSSFFHKQVQENKVPGIKCHSPSKDKFDELWEINRT
ncbi:unnamed protein product [Sphenostylis stenocarpa]|uniref:Uncharacterized protein n=1 Tax=Sphenostylis stenocarpa TaxID=92480 RepID=A0AA86SC12_9FABA|nr:unnamed protein product [Sphenostylis stenocarpa]